MAHLSANLNVAALLRNRRDHEWPDIVGLGRIALEAGAFGLTVHPRPDQRHIRPSDVHDIRAMLDSEFPNSELNVEGFPTPEFLQLVRSVRADQVTLVPDDPGQATSDHGWDIIGNQSFLLPLITDLKASGHRVALFADPDVEQMQAAAETGADRVELYTGPFGGAYDDAATQALELNSLEKAAHAAADVGLGINAGHDLTVEGTAKLIARIPIIAEVSIGHALFCDTLTYGMAETVRRYAASCAGSTRRPMRDSRC